MGGNIDAVVIGAGTGGTAAGVGRYLKERSGGRVQVCVVEPAESMVMQGATHRVHSVVGIGTGLHVPMLEQMEPGAPFVPGAH